MTESKNRCPRYNSLIHSNVVKESAEVKLLGLIIDHKLSLEKNIVKLCKTHVIQAPWPQANKKLYRYHLQSISEVYLKYIFCIKSYRIIIGEVLLCRYHLQSLQCMARILCILNVES